MYQKKQDNKNLAFLTEINKADVFLVNFNTMPQLSALLSLMLVCVIKLHAQFNIMQFGINNQLPTNTCYDFMADEKGFLWLGTDKGLLKFYGRSFQCFNTEPILQKSITQVLSAQKHQKILVTQKEGIWCLENDSLKQLVKDTLFQNAVLTGEELVVYSTSGVFKRIPAFSSVNSPSPPYSVIEQEGKLQTKPLTENKHSTEKNSGFNIASVNHQLFLVNWPNAPYFKGLPQLLNNNTIAYPFPFLNADTIYELKKHGALLVGRTPKELVYFSPFGIEKREALPFPNITQFEENQTYKVFMLNNRSSGSSVSVYLKNKKSWFVLDEKKIQNTAISQIRISGDVIWMSTIGNGLLELIPERKIYLAHFPNPKSGPPLQPKPTTTIQKDMSLLIHTYDSTFNDAVNATFTDGSKTIWLATQKGLAVFKSNTFYRFSKHEGFPSDSAFSISLNNDSNLVITGSSGITVMEPGFPELAPPPKIYVTSTLQFLDTSTLLLKNKDSIHFDIDVINFTISQTFLEYKLNNAPWKPLTSQSLFLSNDGAPEYTILFRARYPNSEYAYSKIFHCKNLEHLASQPWWFHFIIGSFIHILVIFLLYCLSRKKSSFTRP